MGFLRSQRVEIHFLQPNDIGFRFLNHRRYAMWVAFAVGADALVNVIRNCCKQNFASQSLGRGAQRPGTIPAVKRPSQEGKEDRQPQEQCNISDLRILESALELTLQQNASYYPRAHTHQSSEHKITNTNLYRSSDQIHNNKRRDWNNASEQYGKEPMARNLPLHATQSGSCDPAHGFLAGDAAQPVVDYGAYHGTTQGIGKAENRSKRSSSCDDQQSDRREDQGSQSKNPSDPKRRERRIC